MSRVVAATRGRRPSPWSSRGRVGVAVVNENREASFLDYTSLSLVVACGTADNDRMPDDPGSGQPTTTLTITVTAHPEAAPQTWSLQCDPPGGDHPDSVAACAALTRVPDRFAPVPPGMLCAQIYAGPEQATIQGRWRGTPVNATYKRTDGCEIARWNAIATVLQP